MKKNSNKNKIKYIVGVDEVGRGPLAGPVTVCASLVSIHFDFKKFVKNAVIKTKFTDSKGLTKKQREYWNDMFIHGSGDGLEGWLNERPGDDKQIIFSVKSMSAKDIDTYGIAVCIKKLVDKTVIEVVKKANASPEVCHIYLDGGLYAPQEFVSQSTHVKGDALYPIISCASIHAKVSRDTHMEKLAKKEIYSNYLFDIHKGYGTKKHIDAITKFGITDMHRKSFCKNILGKRVNHQR